jgi:hypothetical protein
MISEKTSQKKEQEEKCPAMGRCSPQKFWEMMVKCGEDTKCKCEVMMQEMMKGGGCKQEEK